MANNPRPLNIEDLRRLAELRRQRMEAERAPVEAQVFEAEVIDDRAHRLSSDDIADHADHLGAHLDETDERMEQHVHEVFDHKLGSLSSTPTVTDEPSKCEHKISCGA